MSITLDPYWLLYEIENNKLKASVEDMEDFLNVTKLKIQMSNFKMVDICIFNDKNYLVDISVPHVICTRNDLSYTGIVPIVIHHVKFKIDESWFLMDSLSRDYFGTKDKDRLKKAEKVLKTLSTKYNLNDDGEGYFPLIDWEVSIKKWNPYLQSMFDNYKKSSINNTDDFLFSNEKINNFIQ